MPDCLFAHLQLLWLGTLATLGLNEQIAFLDEVAQCLGVLLGVESVRVEVEWE